MEDAKPETQAPRQLLSSSVELVTRWTATVVLLVYGLGFVILGFHDAKHGVVQFSPFRARILLVGFVFAVLVALAAAAQHYGLAYFGPLEPVVKDNKPERRHYRETVLGAGFIYTAMSITACLGNFLFHSSVMQESQAPALWWRSVQGIGAYLLGLGVFVVAAKIYLRRPGASVLLSLIALAIAVTALVLFWPSRWAYLTLVLALVGWQTMWVKRENYPPRYFLDFRNWYFVLLALWLYINQVFGSLPQRWGGGQPTPVQIFQNSPAPWSPTNPMDALLLDETDQGLYVLLSPTGKAFFLPRSNIASVMFGTKEDLPRPVPGGSK